MLKVYFGHHKCGSTWIIDVLLKVTGYLGMRDYYLQNKFSADYYENVFDRIRSNKIGLLISQSSSMRKTSFLSDFKGFHVVRDPRDICISGYYSHLSTHSVENWSELKELRNKLKKASFDEGLFIEMDFLKEFFDDMHEWDYNQSNILEIKFEKLIDDPVSGFINIFDYLGMLEDAKPNLLKRAKWELLWYIQIFNRRLNYFLPDIDEREKLDIVKMKKIIKYFSFDKLSKGRARGDVDNRSHYRKGVSGDWVKYFNESHKNYFKEKYGNLLIKLNYESTNDW
jgi:sulfotransferase family protein